MPVYIEWDGPGFYIPEERERGIVFSKFSAKDSWPPADAEYFADQSEVAVYDFDIIIEEGVKNETVA